MRARIFAAKAPDGAWEAKIGKGRLQDIELLAQSFALRSGAAARTTSAQIRAGYARGADRRSGSGTACPPPIGSCGGCNARRGC